MNWIDENVAVGSWVDASRFGMLRQNGIEVVMDVRPLFARRPGRLSRIPDVKKVLHAADLLTEMSRRNAKVMIRCRWGKDRTPLVAAAYVSRRNGIPLRNAYELVKQKRSRTKYHWDWLEMLEKGWLIS